MPVVWRAGGDPVLDGERARVAGSVTPESTPPGGQGRAAPVSGLLLAGAVLCYVSSAVLFVVGWSMNRK